MLKQCSCWVVGSGVFTLTPTLSLRERGLVGWYSRPSAHPYLPLSVPEGEGVIGRELRLIQCPWI